MQIKSQATGYVYEVTNVDGWITVSWRDADGVECFTSPTRKEDLAPSDLDEAADLPLILAAL